MKLNSKLTGGLAWAGLVVVLAVPAADFVTGDNGEASAHITSDMDAIRTASVAAPEVTAPQPKPVASRPAVVAPATEVAAAPKGNDPVDAYVQSGKKLPSYISDAPTDVASEKPATTTRLVVPGTGTVNQGEQTQLAALPAQTDSGLVAPIPYPASMRPSVPTTVASVTSDDQPLIIDEDLVQRREAAVAAVLDESPARRNVIESDELEEWDSGSLADYLERRGLISGQREQANAGEFDEDGFFLDEGPNNSNGRRVVRRVRPNEFFFF